MAGKIFDPLSNCGSYVTPILSNGGGGVVSTLDFYPIYPIPFIPKKEVAQTSTSLSLSLSISAEIREANIMINIGIFLTTF